MARGPAASVLDWARTLRTLALCASRKIFVLRLHIKTWDVFRVRPFICRARVLSNL